MCVFSVDGSAGEFTFSVCFLLCLSLSLSLKAASRGGGVYAP